MEMNAMNQVPQNYRRDPRVELARETASVEFESGARRFLGEVLTISASGLAFSLDDDRSLEVGTILTAVSVRIDDRIAQGDLIVRSRRAGDSRVEFGCLFYPASIDDSTNWMLLTERLSGSASSSPSHLSLRCSNCYSTFWIGDTGLSSHSCSVCDQEYGFQKPISANMLADLHRQAREMAAELAIDSQSAVSMLLGMLTMAEVRDILNGAPRAEPAAAAPDERRRHRSDTAFDPAFKPAVEAGTLTVAQAIQRGKREAFAKQLVARHRISLDDALDAADNRTSLLSLLRKRTAGEPIKATIRPKATPARVMVVAALAVGALLVGIGIVGKLDDLLNSTAPYSAVRPVGTGASNSVDPSATANLSELPVESYARVRVDERGEILSVEAADPSNVLLAFCKSHGPLRRLEPVNVAQTDPPSDVARIGVLRDLDQAEDYRVVVIRQDLLTRRWFVGNANNSDSRVPTFPAPERLVPGAQKPL